MVARKSTQTGKQFPQYLNTWIRNLLKSRHRECEQSAPRGFQSWNDSEEVSLSNQHFTLQDQHLIYQPLFTNNLIGI